MSGTTYTPSLRFAIMTPADPAVRNQWGTIWDTTFTIVEQATTGNTAISINGLTSYTLTTANNASDQARQQLYPFTGVLTGDCTITLPSVPKVGWAQNGTTGGHNVILTAGGSRSIIISPGLTYWFTCDGSNVDTIALGLDSLFVVSDVTAGGSVVVGGGLTVDTTLLFPGLQESASYADDATAAAAGVVVGQIYRNGSVVQIRVT